MAFIISLAGIIPQMMQNLFLSNAREVYGPGTEIMAAVPIGATNKKIIKVLKD